MHFGILLFSHHHLNTSFSMAMAAFQMNLSLPVHTWFFFSSCSRSEAVGTSGIDFYGSDAFPVTQPTVSEHRRTLRLWAFTLTRQSRPLALFFVRPPLSSWGTDVAFFTLTLITLMLFVWRGYKIYAMYVLLDLRWREKKNWLQLAHSYTKASSWCYHLAWYEWM